MYHSKNKTKITVICNISKNVRRFPKQDNHAMNVPKHTQHMHASQKNNHATQIIRNKYLNTQKGHIRKNKHAMEIKNMQDEKSKVYGPCWKKHTHRQKTSQGLIIFFTTKSKACLGRTWPTTMGGCGLAYPSLYKFPTDAIDANIQRHVQIAKKEVSQSQGM